MQRSRYLSEIILKGEMKNLLCKFEEFEFVEYTQIFQSLLYFAHIDPLIINEKETNKLEWKKARKEWRNIFPYILSYNPIGPKPEEVKGIYKLNKIQDNLKSAIEKRDEVQKYSFALLQLVDYILLVIKIRFDDIEQRYNTIKQLKQERDEIIKANEEIEEERNKLIEEFRQLNPNFVPSGQIEKKEEEEKKDEVKDEEKKDEVKDEEKKEEVKDEEKKDEVKDEEKKDEVKEEEKKEEEEEGEFNFEEELKKFDDEHPKQEVPPDVEYDLDNDFDIERS